MDGIQLEPRGEKDEGEEVWYQSDDDILTTKSIMPFHSRN